MNEKGIDKIQKDIESLREELESIQKNTYTNLQEREERLIRLLENQEDLREEIKELKLKEIAIKDKIRGYEKIVQKAISDREKLLLKFHKRITVIEQSLGFYIINRLKLGLKNPLKLPVEIFRSIRAVATSVVRKVTKKKKKYNIRKLPINIDEKPPSLLSLLDLNKYEKEVNDLLLTGLFNSPKKLEDLRIACVLDEFSYESFKYDADLITFAPHNWYEVMKTKLPHLLLVESAWKGNNGSWQYKIAKYNLDQGTELDEMIAWCKEHNVPTVFWNKEDPIHFEKFIDAARKFDIIFTSDENCIERYKKETGHDKVYALPFAAQPKIHNPKKISEYKTKNVCFAGSYYANRHESRRLDQEMLLDAAKDFGLEIFDRNYASNNKDNHMMFPERFHPFIKGSLPYNQLVRAYKEYKIFLNINSVDDSNTMFSRRVFELLACGASVISTKSKGVENLFGDIVSMVSTEAEVRNRLQDLLDVRNSLSSKNEIKGVRKVLSHHTYAHRLQIIALKSGFNIEEPYNPAVLIVSKIKHEDDFTKVISSFEKQAYKNKKLVLITESNIEVKSDVTSLILSDNEIDKLDVLLTENDINYNLVGIMNGEAYYGDYYLTDLVLAYLYADTDVVGKASDKEMEYVYTSELIPFSYLIKGNALKQYDIKITKLIDVPDSIVRQVPYGLRMFSVNKYNFSPIRNQLKDQEIEELTI